MFGIKMIKAQIASLERQLDAQNNRYWEMQLRHEKLCDYLKVNYIQRAFAKYETKGGPEKPDDD
jgi:hypothetical protein